MKSPLTLVAIMLALPLSAFAADGQSLFNGKDLDGWRGDPALWTVEDGAILGHTSADAPIKHNTFLIYDKPISNFTLTFRYKIVNHNSGVQYRSHVDDEKGFVVGGYQADIEGGDTYSGILYEERGRGILAQRGEKVVIDADGKKHAERFAESAALQAKIRKNDWNDYKIVADGVHLQHFINGNLTIDVTDNQKDKAAESGVLALQLHAGPPMKVYFKDIVIAPIEAGAKGDSGAKAASNATPHWVWFGQPGEGQRIALRKTFTLDAAPAKAMLAAVADNSITVWINGKVATTNGAWEQATGGDVAKWLVVGENTIAAEAANEGGPGGALVRLVVERKGGSPLTIATDTTWRAAESPKGKWREAGYDDGAWAAATSIGVIGAPNLPWSGNITLAALDGAAAPQPEITATPANQLRVHDGFKAELIYSVPRGQQGSWVNVCVDPKGRLITSDQGGKLYRVTMKGDSVGVEPIEVGIGGAQGLCWAFDSLYVVVSAGKQGLYRVRDTDGDGDLDQATLLRALNGGGEHGPHAVIPSPDGKSLYVIGGNHTKIPNPETSTVPLAWDEDQIIPRMWDANGHARGILAPGGWVCRTDPDGKSFELVSNGYRNQFDIAFNKAGDLFTYDADMEWDIGLPWYRPTRVCHATSGSEFGWRSGTGKWPVHYPDSLPPVVDIGPGSPTGIAFGYGAKFPARYQNALFISDWSYGKLYAVHLKPDGATYAADVEEFISGSPFALTDLVINPIDGAMYCVVGGRNTQSGIYRVSYVGKDSTAPAPADKANDAGALRRKLESYHGHADAAALAAAWPHLSSDDRFIRFAARVAIEWQPVDQWADKALNEKNPQALIEALVALCRHGDKSLQPRIIEALARLDWSSLNQAQKLAALRVYELAIVRMGEPAGAVAAAIVERLGPLYPAATPELNRELGRILVTLGDGEATVKGMKLLADSPTQEEQIDLVLVLRNAKTGWTPPLRQRYFAWFKRAGEYKGGNSFRKFLSNIKADAVATLSDDEKAQLRDYIAGNVEAPATVVDDKPRQLVANYTTDDVAKLAADGLKGRDFANGRKMFAVGACFQCHRFAAEGGSVGPDLTGVAGRFSARDLAESIVEPSKTISDQYGMTIFTMKDGSVIVGRVANLGGDNMSVATNMFDPGRFTGVNRNNVKSFAPSPVSPMPPGLINTMTKDEVLDLMAYLISRGDPDHPAFK